MSPSEVKTFLRELPNFNQVEEAAFDWLIEKGEITTHAKGSFIFKPGDPTEEMLLLLGGIMDIFLDTENGRQEIFLYETGDITGNLPFSRGKVTGAFGRAVEELTLLRLHRSHFVEMVGVSYAMTQALVAVMSDRIRDISQTQFQDEKLKALGKISAGLAHELNNPASAMVRSAEILYQKMGETPANFKSVMRLNINEEQTDGVNDVMFNKIAEREEHPVDFSLLERQDRLDELTDWLEDHDVENADEIAETFTDYNFTEDDLDQMKTVLEESAKLQPVFRWLDNRLSVETLVVEIKEASSRIANLVQSVKKYSHMDQGSGKTHINVQDGLRTTLNILGHRIKQKQIQVDKQFLEDLPQISANPGELNQIWTNLIANAIDALPQGGKITVSTYADRDYLCVDIEDNGPGIPEDLQNRIWEPIFATKREGEGTGLGLDMVKKIVQRHRASIRMQSQPGRTVFIVKFLI